VAFRVLAFYLTNFFHLHIRPLYYHRSGGNSSFSTLLSVLSCGLAAHNHNEDTDQSLRATKNLIQAFGEMTVRKIFSKTW
jgi:hypothetical protein